MFKDSEHISFGNLLDTASRDYQSTPSMDASDFGRVMFSLAVTPRACRHGCARLSRYMSKLKPLPTRWLKSSSSYFVRSTLFGFRAVLFQYLRGGFNSDSHFCEGRYGVSCIYAVYFRSADGYSADARKTSGSSSVDGDMKCAFAEFDFNNTQNIGDKQGREGRRREA